VILLARYVTIGRVAVNMTAGASALGFRRFAAIELVAGTAWALYSVGLGTIGGQNQNPLPAAGIAIASATAVAVLVERATAF
jgi:membrane protein DedA with SNARE-associated domain